MEICSKEMCTGCGVCEFICPKKCITMQENETGIVYPVVSEDSCVNCGLCKKKCPQLNSPEFNEPLSAYASWSTDEEERRTSASGGIASEIYRYALADNCYIVGTVQNPDFSVELTVTDDSRKIKEFKNSKYVVSTAYNLYPKLKEKLDNGEKIIIIALPCQIAAMKMLYKNNIEQITFADVVCHGVTPVKYLQQHIQYIESKSNDKAAYMYFRDPEFLTNTFTLSLYNKNNERFYSQRTKDGDTYQFGYHRTVTYRENCYHCRYATGKRISDITLSDYKGLGKLEPFSYDKEKVSSVLVNTPKGEKLIKKMIDSNQIFAEKRPVQEPIQGDPQLRHPSDKSRRRKDFEKYIVSNNGDFESAMNKVIKREKYRDILRKCKRILKKVAGK